MVTHPSVSRSSGTASALVMVPPHASVYLYIFHTGYSPPSGKKKARGKRAQRSLRPGRQRVRLSNHTHREITDGTRTTGPERVVHLPAGERWALGGDHLSDMTR